MRIRAAYDRAESLNRRTQGLVVDDIQALNFLPDSTRLWYRKTVTGGHEFVLVDADARAKRPAFDHARLATSLSAATKGTYTAEALPLTGLRFVDGVEAIEFSLPPGGGLGVAAGGRQGGGPGPAPDWRCTLADYACTRLFSPPRQDQPARGQVRPSPDGRWQAMIQNHNIHVRPVPAAAGAPSPGFVLSTDRSEGNAYTLNSIRWSPDSKKLAAFRRRPGYERLVHYVESSPADQIQPKHTTNFYRKPGDVVDFDHPVVFDVETRRQIPGDIALFPNPYANTRLEWRSDSRAVTFEYNQRGHQIYRVLEIDAATGRTRTVIEEAQKTFVEYSAKRFREDVADGREISSPPPA